MAWEATDAAAARTGPLADALRDYLANEPPMVPAEDPDEAQRERLRALGYIDPD